MLGLELVSARPERVEARLVVRADHQQPYGIVHGGVYASIAETVASVGAVVALQAKTGQEDAGAVGQSNHTDFLKATRDGVLRAVATPVHVGRSVQLWQIDITQEDGSLAARSTVRMFNVGVERMSGQPAG